MIELRIREHNSGLIFNHNLMTGMEPWAISAVSGESEKAMPCTRDFQLKKYSIATVNC
jgi:hypothetical protein